MTEVTHGVLSVRGGQIAYRRAGEGPVVVLLHGLASSAATWDEVIPALAEHMTVIAPDLPGHGGSTNPGGDYSLGAHATSIRDLLSSLDIERATLVGHSFGGGVAMQAAYQFPERCERLVLVDSGGLGREVALGLRALSLPGAELALAIGCAPQVFAAGERIGGWLERIGVRPTASARQLGRSHASLATKDARTTLVRTLRSVIDAGGQSVSAHARLALAADIPTLIVWGARDRIIPVTHAYDTHLAIHGSALEIFPEAGHFPHAQDPDRFAATLDAFIASRPAAVFSEERLRALLRE